MLHSANKTSCSPKPRSDPKPEAPSMTLPGTLHKLWEDFIPKTAGSSCLLLLQPHGLSLLTGCATGRGWIEQRHRIRPSAFSFCIQRKHVLPGLQMHCIDTCLQHGTLICSHINKLLAVF